MSRVSKIQFTLISDGSSDEITYTFGIYLCGDDLTDRIEQGLGVKVEDLGLFSSQAEACDDDSYKGESVAALVAAIHRDRASVPELLLSEGFCFTSPGSNTLKAFVKRACSSSVGASAVKSVAGRGVKARDGDGPSQTASKSGSVRSRLSDAEYSAIDSVLQFLWPWSDDGLPLPARLTEKGKDKTMQPSTADDDGAPKVAVPWVKTYLSRILGSVCPEIDNTLLLATALRRVPVFTCLCLSMRLRVAAGWRASNLHVRCSSIMPTGRSEPGGPKFRQSTTAT